MKYKVKIHPKANKFLNKLEKHLSDRIKFRLKLLEEKPFRFLEHYEGENFYKFRTGNYRALIDLDQTRKIIFVRVINHRKKIYKQT
ncbi:type II toxin-antitoxin system RelE/ParE family toxin [Candidatus Woesearchaeota archaeon]|nr:type II toxin-antitoxin system RelE/ParE family toxin [Candidatus Woesearchaeota archaeon]